MRLLMSLVVVGILSLSCASHDSLTYTPFPAFVDSLLLTVDPCECAEECHCAAIELYPNNWLKLHRYIEYGDSLIVTPDTTLAHASDDQLRNLTDLLATWETYEAYYDPGPSAMWPTASGSLARYLQGDTSRIFVCDLYEETIPPTPPALKEAVWDVYRLHQALVDPDTLADGSALRLLGCESANPARKSPRRPSYSAPHAGSSPTGPDPE
jgi:hypothetical protein